MRFVLIPMRSINNFLENPYIFVRHSSLYFVLLIVQSNHSSVPGKRNQACPSARWLAEGAGGHAWTEFSKRSFNFNGLCAIEIASNWKSIKLQLRTCPNFRFTFQHAWFMWFDSSLFVPLKYRLFVSVQQHCNVTFLIHPIIYSIAFEIGIVK